MNFLSGLTKGSKHYDDSLGKFSFQYKVSLRKSLRKRSAENTFAGLIDLKADFFVPEDYDGPMIEADDKEVTPGQVEVVKRRFAEGKSLHRRCIYAILVRMERFYRDPKKSATLVDVKLAKDAVINICGDIHGQYYDLLKILKEKGPPTANNLYLFNGDIVDKGPMSTECILLLFLLKLAHPKWVFVNRGNHESAIVNATHGFAKETKMKFDDFFLFQYFTEVFRWMPLAHLIADRILVVHGGLSSNLQLKIEDIRRIRRPVEPYDHELTGEILWSDPAPKIGPQDGTWASPRGIGVFFGPDVTRRFLDNNDLLCIVRSHSEISEGCGLNHEGCYTVYSAPSRMKGVLAGVMTVDGKHLNKEGSVFPEVAEAEIDAFKRGEFWKSAGYAQSIPAVDTEQKL